MIVKQWDARKNLRANGAPDASAEPSPRGHENRAGKSRGKTKNRPRILAREKTRRRLGAPEACRDFWEFLKHDFFNAQEKRFVMHNGNNLSCTRGGNITGASGNAGRLPALQGGGTATKGERLMRAKFQTTKRHFEKLRSEAAKQREPNSRAAKQREPSSRAAKQREPNSRAAKQREPSSRAAKQREPNSRAAKQRESNSRAAKQRQCE